MADERCGYPSPLIFASDLGIDEKSMIAAIPRHVHKADEGAAGQSGGYPAQAVPPHLVPPPGHWVPTMSFDEFYHFHVGDCSSPAVLNLLSHRHFPGHRACLAAIRSRNHGFVPAAQAKCKPEQVCRPTAHELLKGVPCVNGRQRRVRCAHAGSTTASYTEDLLSTSVQPEPIRTTATRGAGDSSGGTLLVWLRAVGTKKPPVQIWPDQVVAGQRGAQWSWQFASWLARRACGGTAERARGDAVAPAEPAGQMALIGKARLRCRRADRASLRDQVARA